jgi:SAM-dependent methyltransferase
VDDFPHQDTQISELHTLRHQTILSLVIESGVSQVLDLGCGSGGMLWHLLQETQLERVIGLEQSGISMLQARDKLASFLQGEPPRLQLINRSYLEPLPEFHHFPMVLMIETIEHVAPQKLSQLEHNMFERMQPEKLIVTTPNSEYNPLYGLAPGQFRDPDHKFEWSRQKFQQWARGVALRQGYQVQFEGIGEADAECGSPTQMAHFQLQSPDG